MNILKGVQLLRKACGQLNKDIEDLKNDIKLLKEEHRRDIKQMQMLRKQDTCKHEWREFRIINGSIYLEECSYCGKELFATDNEAEWERRKYEYEFYLHTEALKKLKERKDNDGNSANIH